MRWLSLVLTVALLAGCGGESWHTKDIDGLMPDLAFTLTGEGGKTVHGREYRGQVTLVYFGYTYCPDVCPMTLARLSSVLDRLTPAQRDDVSVLFVSVDPRRDSPERLAKYTAAF
ncbi:MAG: SCO family protein, partial [Ectothiorhodospiraceae bacterium]